MSEEYSKIKERLLKRSKWNGECLICTVVCGGRYAQLKVKGKLIGAHRLSYIVNKGEITEGMCVLHNCPNGNDNPRCINPDHLFLGTLQDNTNDMIAKNRDNYQGARKHDKCLEEKAIQLRIEGKTYKEISELLNIPWGSLQAYFKKIDGLCDPKYSEETIKKAVHLRESGVLCKDIQKILNIPKRSLTRIYKKYYSPK